MMDLGDGGSDLEDNGEGIDSDDDVLEQLREAAKVTDGGGQA